MLVGGAVRTVTKRSTRAAGPHPPGGSDVMELNSVRARAGDADPAAGSASGRQRSSGDSGNPGQVVAAGVGAIGEVPAQASRTWSSVAVRYSQVTTGVMPTA